MDGGAISPTSCASPSSFPARNASAEHADSPLKKKPRLESTSPRPLGMSDRTHFNSTPPPEQSSSQPRPATSSLPQTPSKLTVDLRRSRPLPSPSKPVNGLHEPTRPESDCESAPSPTQDTTQSEDRLSSPETLDTIEANPDPRHEDDPPVVEIKLDDDGEYYDEDTVRLPAIGSVGTSGSRLIEEFPVNPDVEPVQRLRICCSFFEIRELLLLQLAIASRR